MCDSGIPPKYISSHSQTGVTVTLHQRWMAVNTNNQSKHVTMECSVLNRTSRSHTFLHKAQRTLWRGSRNSVRQKSGKTAATLFPVNTHGLTAAVADSTGPAKIRQPTLQSGEGRPHPQLRSCSVTDGCLLQQCARLSMGHWVVFYTYVHTSSSD